MIKTEKSFHRKTCRGSKVRVFRVVREHYLRERIPCFSSLCLAGCDNGRGSQSRKSPYQWARKRLVEMPVPESSENVETDAVLDVHDYTSHPSPEGKVLSGDVTHYVVPDAGVVMDYLEILENRELQGIVFTQTACQAVQHSKGHRHYSRLRNLLKDPQHDCVVFSNEFQQYSYCPREKGESQEKWHSRSVYSAAVWYYNHLAGMMKIVMVTHDPDVISEYSILNSGVYVISVEDYLRNFYAELHVAQELYSSISQSLHEKKSEGLEREYGAYLSADVLEAGIQSGKYIQGTLNVNKHRPQQEAFVTTADVSNKNTDHRSDVLVFGTKNRNRAVHGDMVVVALLPKSEWRGKVTTLTEGSGEDKSVEGDQSKHMPTGRVVGILQRNWRDYVVTFPSREEIQNQSRNSQRILAVPWDPRIPKIRISSQQADALQDHRVVVRIDSWEKTSLYPNGHRVRVLGRAGELETEIQTILIENCIHVPPFSEAQLKEMPINSPEKPWRVDPAQVSVRRDLRESHLVFSIDPKDCEDVDDALSVHNLADGKVLELGVHIADVTHFVAEGSLTDLEARTRSTTYYLADRRYDMLPAALSADLCSLLGGVDRYAISVLWELDASTLAVNKVWYGRTLIRSSYQLHYEPAQALLNGEPAEVPELAQLGHEEKDQKLTQLTQALEMLTHVARHLRAQRDIGGALELEGVEVRAQLDKERNITGLIPRQALEVHETVAECMIYANHCVARKIQESFPHQALLRHHPPPQQELFSQLVDCAQARGFTMDTRSNKALAESLDKAVDPQDPLVNKLLRMMVTQAMSEAQYFSTGAHSQQQYFHYGLALDHYTHFTSPIRRYADIIVHRLLMAAIAMEKGEEPGKAVVRNKQVEELAQHINKKNRAAQRAQKLSTELFQCLFFKEMDPETDQRCVADAVIYGIRDNGVLVFVPQYGVKGPVYMKSPQGEVVTMGKDGICKWQLGSVQRHSDHIVTKCGAGSSTFRLFNHVTVRISVHPSHCHADSLKLQIISNKPHQTAEPQQPQQPRPQLVQEVVQRAEEATQQAREKEARNSKLTKEEREFCQSKSPNLYTFLQEFRELALMDLETLSIVGPTGRKGLLLTESRKARRCRLV